MHRKISKMPSLIIFDWWAHGYHLLFFFYWRMVRPLIQTFKFRAFKDANVHSHVQSRKFAPVSGVHCHVRASSTSGCAFVYFTVQYCIEYGSTVSLFQAQDVQKQVSKQQWCSWYCKVSTSLQTNWTYEHTLGMELVPVIVDLQCCVSFWNTAKWFSHLFVYLFFFRSFSL